MFKEDKKEIKRFILYITYGVVLYFLLLNFSTVSGVVATLLGILAPFILGFAFAFILDKPYLYIRDKLLKVLIDKENGKERRALRSGIAVGILYFIVALVLVLLASFVIPQLVKSISGIVNSIPEYSKNIYALYQDTFSKIIKNETIRNTLENANIQVMTYLKKALSAVGPFLFDSVSGFASNVFNIAIATIVSVYVLAGREHLLYQYRLLVKAFFKEETANKIMEVSYLTADTFSDFIGGQIVDAIVIGVLCGIGLTVMRMPYAILIGTIVGCTNIIPYFGPWIGSVPSALILLMVKPSYALIFIIFVIVLQQVDSNIIYPIVVGNSVGLNALFVTFAIIVGGGLFGVLGMILGVPGFALVYTLLKNRAYKNIKNKNITKI